MDTQNASQLNDLRFKAENEDGVVLECEALLMFDSPFFGKSYIVYLNLFTAQILPEIGRMGVMD